MTKEEAHGTAGCTPRVIFPTTLVKRLPSMRLCARVVIAVAVACTLLGPMVFADDADDAASPAEPRAEAVSPGNVGSGAAVQKRRARADAKVR